MVKRPQSHRNDRILDELIDISMNQAREAAKRLERAETLEEIEACTLAFERATEDVCASIALSRKLQRDREELRREEEAEAAKVAARRKAAESLAEEVKGPRLLH
jgi:hypothetical protein